MKDNVFIVPEGTTVITENMIPEDVTEVVIPDSVIKIEDYAFRNCELLKIIIRPEKIEYIGKYAFENCKVLKYIIIRKGCGYKIKILRRPVIPKTSDKCINPVHERQQEFLRHYANQYHHK